MTVPETVVLPITPYPNKLRQIIIFENNQRLNQWRNSTLNNTHVLAEGLIAVNLGAGILGDHGAGRKTRGIGCRPTVTRPSYGRVLPRPCCIGQPANARSFGR